MPDFSHKTTAELETLLANYRRLGKDQTDTFLALLAERDRRATGKDRLMPGRSLALLREAARQKTYVTYGEVARASDLKWSNTLRARMSGPGGHLDRLMDFCHSHHLPLLPALCVNQENRESGALDAAALAGFANGARRLGLLVTDEEAFLRQSQKACFAWGATAPAAAPPGPPAAPAMP